MATSRTSQQSPRSPAGGVTSVHLPNEQQSQQPPSSQQQPSQQQSQQSQQPQQPQQHPMRSTSQGRVTPPVPTASHVPSAPGSAISKVQQARGTSPGGLVGQQPPLGSAAASGGAQQPTRASSAPRVQGIGGHHHATPQPVGSNVRTASQPMAASTGHARQPAPLSGNPGGYSGHLPGSHSPTSPLVAGSATGQNQHFGHVQQTLLHPASPAVRGTSPGPTQVGGMPVPLRGTLGGHTGARNPSPIGLQSPAGHSSVGGHVPFGSVSAAPGGHRPDMLSATTRGRSPPPMTTAGPGSGPTAVRQPRAVTPSSLVKGITQGIHAAGMVQRGSIGGASGVHRGF